MTENEEKKAFLMSYQNAKRKIQRLEEQMAEVRLNKMHPSVINDGMPHGTDKRDLSDYMAIIDELEERKKKAEYERDCLKLCIKSAIGSLENVNQKTVLRAKYLNSMNWNQISVLTGKSIRQVIRIHEKALTQIVVLGIEMSYYM